MGSGTSGVAALELGYKYLGVEQDPEWLKIAEIRVAGAAAQGSFYQQRHLTTVCTGLAKAGQTQLGLQIE
jgi:DNA modification methylase